MILWGRKGRKSQKQLRDDDAIRRRLENKRKRKVRYQKKHHHGAPMSQMKLSALQAAL